VRSQVAGRYTNDDLKQMCPNLCMRTSWIALRRDGNVANVATLYQAALSAMGADADTLDRTVAFLAKRDGTDKVRVLAPTHGPCKQRPPSSHFRT